MNHVSQLVEALQRGNLALFIGGDLPQELTGLPGRADLAAALAKRLGIGGPPPPWPEVAAQYEAGSGLNGLISWLQEQIELSEHQPGPIYRLLAQLPVATFITTTYDTFLCDMLREAKRRPNSPVVDAAGLGLVSPNRPTVVQLFGVRDQPASLALTVDHLLSLPQGKAQILAGLVRPALANKSVLILGQDLRDTYFKTLYAEALFQAGTIRPPALAVWPGLADWEKQIWLRQEVRVIDMPAMELLSWLVAELSGVPPVVSPPVTTGSPVDSSAEGSQRAVPHVDPGNPPIAAIRELLTAAFTSQTLHRFCYDRPAFRPVVNQISPDHGLDDMVDRVLVHCEKKLLWDELLAEVAQENPAQYARFRPRLGGKKRG